MIFQQPQHQKRSSYEIQQILDLQNYSDFKNPQHLVHLSLNKNNSFQIWEKIQQLVNPEFQDKKSKIFEQKVKKAQKLELDISQEVDSHNMLELIEKYGQPKNIQKRFLKVWKKKILRGAKLDYHRKEAWLIASNAKYYIKEKYKGYYDQLKRQKNFPDYFEDDISKDVHRTFKGDSEQEELKLQQLFNILIVYSRRNSTLGYCQGMNFIVSFLLQKDFLEEECFWILANLIEEILPNDYFTTMTGALCDRDIFKDLLLAYNERIYEKLEQVELDLTIFCTNWFVCLFTNSLPEQIIDIVWDNIFHEGILALFKTGLIILQECEDQILEVTSFPEVIIIVEQFCKNMNAGDIFREKMAKIYINRKLIEYSQALHRKKFMLQNEQEQKKRRKNIDPNLNSKIDEQIVSTLNKIDCKPYWPVCHHYLYKTKPKDRINIEAFVFKEQFPIENLDYCHFSYKNLDKNKINCLRDQYNNINNNNNYNFPDNELDFLRNSQSSSNTVINNGIIPKNLNLQNIQNNNNNESTIKKNSYSNISKSSFDYQQQQQIQQKQLFFQKNQSLDDDLQQLDDFLTRQNTSLNFKQFQTDFNSTVKNSRPKISVNSIKNISNLLIERHKHVCLEFQKNNIISNSSNSSQIKENNKNSNVDSKIKNQTQKLKFYLENGDCNNNSSSIKSQNKLNYLLAEQEQEEQEIQKQDKLVDNNNMKRKKNNRSTKSIDFQSFTSGLQYLNNTEKQSDLQPSPLLQITEQTQSFNEKESIKQRYNAQRRQSKSKSYVNNDFDAFGLQKENQEKYIDNGDNNNGNETNQLLDIQQQKEELEKELKQYAIEIHKILEKSSSVNFLKTLPKDQSERFFSKIEDEDEESDEDEDENIKNKNYDAEKEIQKISQKNEKQCQNNDHDYDYDNNNILEQQQNKDKVPQIQMGNSNNENNEQNINNNSLFSSLSYFGRIFNYNSISSSNLNNNNINIQQPQQQQEEEEEKNCNKPKTSVQNENLFQFDGDFKKFISSDLVTNSTKTNNNNSNNLQQNLQRQSENLDNINSTNQQIMLGQNLVPPSIFQIDHNYFKKKSKNVLSRKMLEGFLDLKNSTSNSDLLSNSNNISKNNNNNCINLQNSNNTKPKNKNNKKSISELPEEMIKDIDKIVQDQQQYQQKKQPQQQQQQKYQNIDYLD